MPEGEVRGGVSHGEGGKFEDKYSDNEVVQALADVYPEPATNQDVADAIGCVKATAHNKLHDLHDEGEVRTKKVGAKARVWWVDMTEPAPPSTAPSIREVLEDDRQRAIAVASRFKPEFNPTRTGTDEIVDFVMDQPWGEVTRALNDRLQEEETDG